MICKSINTQYKFNKTNKIKRGDYMNSLINLKRINEPTEIIKKLEQEKQEMIEKLTGHLTVVEKFTEVNTNISKLVERV